ncbi:hypothetical protein I4U23_017064 [Adineta vaga]|nr:hypothetical protein I4U23_017064 [Adineta vaga]
MVVFPEHYLLLIVMSKVYGGERSVKESWGWIVSLMEPIRNKSKHMCAAVIIDPNYLITAAHCVEDEMYTLSNTIVCAGSDRWSDGCQQKRSINKIFIHHEYNNKTSENDIAILHLDEPLNFTDRWISKICLPNAKSGSQYPLPNTDVVAIGWGRTGISNTSTDNLQQVSLKVIDNLMSRCSTLISNRTVQICAYAPHKDTCKGDSGGPLMRFVPTKKRWELVGITSFGDFGCTSPMKAGIYTRVSVYHNFINSVIRNKYKPPVNKLYTCKCQCPFDTDSGIAFTSTYSVQSCINSCIKVEDNSCLANNTYACLNSTCIHSSLYNHSLMKKYNAPNSTLILSSVVTYSNGNNYTGQLKNGFRHGVGTCHYSNGNKYVGDWIEGDMTGRGVMTWYDGDIYVGDWINGKRHGKGDMIWSNGTIYTGDWINDMQMGQGIFRSSDGERYEGRFKDGFRHGVGTCYYSNGNKYVGNWTQGVQTGQGVMRFSDGSQYSGTWLNYNRNGEGLMIWSDGDIYIGGWIDDMQTGQGIFEWADGERYEGRFKGGFRHGVGTYYYSNGNKYVGDWIEGDMTGRGVMTWYDGDIYVGDWINGKRHGKGVMTWYNGDTYVGDWINDKRHGRGSAVLFNDNYYMGDWKNDTRDGEGIMTWSGGDTYMGSWYDDMRTGYGVYTSSDGTKCKGRFNEGKFSDDSKCNIEMKL